jgi:multidrug efflux system membrane fusion protein
MKKIVGQWVAIAALVLFIISSGLVFVRMEKRPRTDDAFILADIANIAPDVSGRIVALNVRDNQSVHAGDVLFVVDPESYQRKLDAAKAKAVVAASTLARMEPLLKKGYVTAEQIDQAKAEKESALATQAVAEHDFENTRVKAPFDGKITGLNMAVGEYASTGHPLFTMINTAKWYVLANFRETEIDQLKQGTSATVYVMTHPEQRLEGHVDSIGWGVTSQDVSLASNGLPKVEKNLNWVRLAQRFPVRILLDHPPEDLMRIGASAIAVVNHDSSG